MFDFLLEALCQEVVIWSNLEHPNLLPFFGCDQELFCDDICLVSPWAHGGNIKTFLNTPDLRGNMPISNKQLVGRLVRSVSSLRKLTLIVLKLAGVLAGLSYLHNVNVVHGDLHYVCPALLNKGIRPYLLGVPIGKHPHRSR